MLVEPNKHPYALIPRVSRFIKDGKDVPLTVVNLLRNYPQLFENVSNVIKYKSDPFFSKETPEVDWALVACETLPESRNKNYSQQRIVIKQYAQKHKTTELRVRRRNLVDALYDVIVVHTTVKENILKETVDMTESKHGVQNFVCINHGDQGIRINDVSRQQAHQLLGVCPNW